MEWILMKPADNKESMRVSEVFTTTGECLFDLSKHGAKLKPFALDRAVALWLKRICTPLLAKQQVYGSR